MKVIYKTVVLDEENELFHYEVIETHFCCEPMKAAVKADIVALRGNQVCLQELEKYDRYLTIFDPAIQFCPFCGEGIETEEGKKVGRELRQRKTKPIPAKTEKYYAEVPYKPQVEKKGDWR